MNFSINKFSKIKPTIIFLTIFLGFFLLPKISSAEMIFSSKWDNPGANDGGNWWLVEPFGGYGGGYTRVSGGQSGVGGGGPTGVPSQVAGSTTYYLRIEMIPTGGAWGGYLQAFSENSTTYHSDLYMGMWAFFETGTVFYDSVKWMDFRTQGQQAGNGHLALFGLDHSAVYCNTTAYGTRWEDLNYASWWDSAGPDHNLIVFRYLSGLGQVVSGNEYTLNYYDNSCMFDNNLNSSQQVVGRSGYNPANVNRIHITGGYWTAFIVHAKIHATDGVYEAWIKKGTDPLYKTMEWNRDTVWSSDNSTPHNFYTANGPNAINHLQVNGTWNILRRTQNIWISNVAVGTTFGEVANYLGVDASPDTTPPAAPTGVKVN